MSFPIVVIHSMSEHEVVVDDLWVLEGDGLHRSTFFPITSCLLPIVMVIGPICGHERHDVIRFFYGIDMKGDIVKCPCNRILSKVQKSFWSCTHVNSCQKYTLYINLHILLNISSKATSNTQESRKSIKRLKT